MCLIERAGILVGCLLVVACAEGDGVTGAPPDIVATNAFYYYEDVDAAWRFYTDVIGFETVVDYGFAKILRVAEASYLTVVRASEGMHAADEPKTTVLYLVTDELSRWYDHLVAQGVPITVPYASDDGSTSNSFVAEDPNGYALKFVRFNPHPNHDAFVADIANASPLPAIPEVESGLLSVRAVAHAVYFDDLAGISPFYESLFGVSTTGEIDGRAAYRLSPTGYLVLIGGGDELHVPTEQNGVTLSFLTSDVDAWFARAAKHPGFVLRTESVLTEGERVRVFVGYDPAGTYLEWDTFLDVPDNRKLLGYLP